MESRDASKRKELVENVEELRDLIKSRSSIVAGESENSDLSNYTRCVTDCKNSILHFSRLWKWHESSKEAFVESGSLDAILNLLELQQEKYSWEERSSASKEIEYAIVALLTKLSTCEAARDRVAHKGGIQMIMKSLGLLQTVFNFGLREGHDLMNLAALCLLSYCSSELCQLQVLKTPGALSQLLRFRSTLRSQFLPAKLIFRMSVSLGSHQYLANPDLVNQLVAIVKSSVAGYKEEDAEPSEYWSDNTDCTNYHWTSLYILLAFCRLILLAPLTKVCLYKDHIQEIVQLIQEYLVVCKDAPHTNKINHSIFPFLEAAYAPQSRQLCSPADINVLQRLIFLSLESDLSKSSPDELSGVIEFIICLQWYAPTAETGKRLTNFIDILHQQILMLAQLERTAKRLRIEAPEYALPSLQTISRAALATGGFGLENAMKHIRDIVLLK